MLKFIMTRIALIACLCSLSVSAYAVADGTKHAINIPPEDLSTALEQLSKQSGTDLVYRPEQVRGYSTRALIGQYSAEEAIAKLIRGTQLTLSTDSSGALLIAAPLATTTTAAQNSPSMPDGQPSPEQPRSSLQLAQATPGQTSSPATVEKQDEQTSKKKAVQLEEVIVTGSRLPQETTDGPLPVRIVTREQIDALGATNVAEVFNSLPEVSTSSTGSFFQNNNALGSSSVQLRGLPAGTTLVLINGERTGSFAAAGGNDGFNIGNIPLAAVDRIEVVPTGSSAVYGGDALAGVVNIVLKKDFQGLDASVSYGGADNTNEKDASVAWGWKSDAGSLVVIGAYRATTPLTLSDRAFSRDGNFTALGGPDYRNNASPLANLYSLNGQNLPGLTGPEASVPPGSTGIGLTPSDFSATTGVVNLNFPQSTASLIPDSKQYSMLLTGRLNVTADVELFSDVLYTHSRIASDTSETGLTDGEYGAQFVSASSPFNPFGVNVGVDYLFKGYDQCYCVTEQYFRPVFGARGNLTSSWGWEVSGLYSSDRLENVVANMLNPVAVQNALSASNPATALNVFKDGPAGSPQLLNSLFTNPTDSYQFDLKSVTALLRGPIAHLGSGDIETVVGAQYEQSNLTGNISSSGPTQYSGSRNYHAAFGEFRVPLIGPRDGAQSENTLAIQGALRYDSYSDFGSRTSPQIATVFRPIRSLLFRASYSSAFKPPPLIDLVYPQTTYPGYLQYFALIDPLRGDAVLTSGNWIIGGNPNLKATTGDTRSFGIVFEPERLSGLRAAITDWTLTFKDSIESPNLQYLIDNEDSLPGRVTRGPSQNGEAGQILSVNDTYINLGRTDESGVDFDLSFKTNSPWGEWTPALSATATYKYATVVTPGTPVVNVVSAANYTGFAPRWKGLASLGWKPTPPLQFSLFAHYVGSYRDYEPLTDGVYQMLGNFWTFDASGKYEWTDVGLLNARAPSASVTVGAVNLTNKLPVFSTYAYFDPTQYDARGRFLYVRLEVRL